MKFNLAHPVAKKLQVFGAAQYYDLIELFQTLNHI